MGPKEEVYVNDAYGDLGGHLQGRPWLLRRWRRLRDWQKAGVWCRLHRVLLDELGKAGLIDWSLSATHSVVDVLPL